MLSRLTLQLSTFTSWVPRRFLYAVIGLIAAGAIVGGYFYIDTTAQELEEADIQTAPVRQGDLILRASGAGSVIPAREVELGFGSAGESASCRSEPNLKQRMVSFFLVGSEMMNVMENTLFS